MVLDLILQICCFFLYAEDARFTLRLYRAGTSIHEIRSEVYWLQALWNTGRVKTLSPVPGRDGEMIQCVSPNDLPSRYATLYDWIPGETLHALPAAEKTPELIRSLGVMVGRMHSVSQTLELPHWFTRPRYDADWVTSKIEVALRSDDMDASPEDRVKLSSLSFALLTICRRTRGRTGCFWVDSLGSGTP